MSKTIDPAKLSPSELATLLSRGGDRKVTKAQIEASIVAGAPANDDGTLHLVRFTAWLVTVQGDRPRAN